MIPKYRLRTPYMSFVNYTPSRSVVYVPDNGFVTNVVGIVYSSFSCFRHTREIAAERVESKYILLFPRCGGRSIVSCHLGY